ncbi:MAG: pteridine reductase [Enterobacterales bacterium]|jgi:pteridine reductase
MNVINNDTNINNDSLPVALITGSARRIGAEIARHLHQADYQIIIHCNHSVKDAKALADELNERRANSARVIQADLSSTEGCTSLIEAAINPEGLFDGRVDALINNASAFYPTKVSDVTDADWQQLFNTNLKAPFTLAQQSTATLKQYQGSIINITDIHGERPLKGYSVYSMTKAGLISMTHSLAKELAPEIRVNGVSPGAILWPEADEADGDGSDEKQLKVLAKIPLKRMGVPNNIAQSVLFLLANDYITGQIISVDGGRSL